VGDLQLKRDLDRDRDQMFEEGTGSTTPRSKLGTAHEEGMLSADLQSGLFDSWWRSC